jgi:cobalt-zinc-cadmium efflux system outer membrane protein
MYPVILKMFFLSWFFLWMGNSWIWANTRQESIEKSISADNSLTLAQAVSFALNREPELLAASLEVRAREALELQTGLLPNPELAFEMENFGGSDTGLDNSESSVQLRQLIELGGKRSKRKHIAALEKEIALSDYKAKYLETISETSKKFMEVLAWQERVSLATDSAFLAEGVFNTVSQRVKAGKVSPLEETKAKVAWATSRIELKAVEQSLGASLRRLTVTWGDSVPKFERVHGNMDPIQAPLSLDVLLSQISSNPNVSRQMLEIRRQQILLNLAKAKRIPDPILAGGMRRFEETQREAYLMEVSFPLPIFDRNQGAIQEAELNLEKAQEGLKKINNQISIALSNAYQEQNISFSEATALKQEVLPGSESAFNAAKEGYRQGKLDYLDVLDAQRTFFEAKRKYVDSLLHCHTALAEIERLIGKNIPLVV